MIRASRTSQADNIVGDSKKEITSSHQENIKQVEKRLRFVGSSHPEIEKSRISLLERRQGRPKSAVGSFMPSRHGLETHPYSSNTGSGESAECLAPRLGHSGLC